MEGTSFDTEWDLDAYITSRHWDLVASPQGEGILSVPLPWNYELDVAPNASAVPALLASRSDAPILDLLELLRCGGFLLDLRGRVLSLNTVARGCLGDGLVLRRDRLRGTDRVTDHRLQTMIASAIARTDGPGTPTSVAIRRRVRLPLVIRSICWDQGPQQRPAGLLLLALDPELRPEPPHEILTQAFGLTRTEAIIAGAIASGKSLAEIAADRGIRIGTVRDYAKVVFSKTQTRGQAELTGVLTRLASLIPQVEAGAQPRPEALRDIR